MTFTVEGELTSLSEEDKTSLKDNIKTAIANKLNISLHEVSITLQSGSIKIIINITTKTNDASIKSQTDFNDAGKVASFLKVCVWNRLCVCVMYHNKR